MRKFILLVATTLLSMSAFSADFSEGKHYTVLEASKSSTPTVTEFFSFYCPHCYGFEPVMEGLKDELPNGAKFQKVHVSFMGNSMAIPMAKAYATMVALKVEDQVVMPMFKQIHDFKNAPSNVSELRQIFVDNGVSGEKFDSTFNGFAVDSMQKRFDKQFKATGLTGVPGVVVNNKYIVKADEIKTIDEYYQLVNYLLTL
ncbi:thiol:disulfide interchange protein DsbA/DsbL [Vibrio algarum]|uniref:Thiol:disulfide interchange protein n=1 Tax=Vibrio algarum TaxID=3020714 RepID=A0ABT4YWQ3_9VIBR|nr:thiol:disulfide interchange protein DsbA/DsbL [Vibrio sp. KJ40-1]MDB1125822.1 thiol:disulfide interchange protein DsbA/DsbL [Vibrio sp. KJ40-1]